jgi:lysophospholipase L1-like esterase
VVVGLLLFELGLWLLAPQRLLGDHDGYRLIPGTPYYLLKSNYRHEVNGRFGKYTFATNSYGIRDFEFDSGKAHPRRVLFLGDSQTAGWGVELEETFVKRFQKQIEAATGQEWQALNLAIGGGSTFDELYAYRTLGTPLVHQYVILGFYFGNDVSDNVDFQTRPIPTDSASPVQRTFVRRTQYFLARKSQVYNLLRDSLNAPILYRLGLKYDSNAFLDMLRSNDPDQIKYGWQLTFKAIQELQAAVASQNAKLILLLIPQKVQLQRATLDASAELYRVSPQDLEVARPQRILKEYAQKAGIPVVDLLEHLKPNEDLYYFPTDIHLNAGGHAATGDILAREFLNQFEIRN